MSRPLLTKSADKPISGLDITKLILSDRLPDSYDLDMLKSQLDLLCHFCQNHGLSIEQIVNDFINKDESDSSKLENLLHETESHDLIDKYYSTTTQYLVELTLHECSWDYKKLFSSIFDFIKKRKIKGC